MGNRRNERLHRNIQPWTPPRAAKIRNRRPHVQINPADSCLNLISVFNECSPILLRRNVPPRNPPRVAKINNRRVDVSNFDLAHCRRNLLAELSGWGRASCNTNLRRNVPPRNPSRVAKIKNRRSDVSNFDLAHCRRNLLAEFSDCARESCNTKNIIVPNRTASHIMPSASNDGVYPIDLEDIELKNVQQQAPIIGSEGGCLETRVRTDRGELVVAVKGDRSKPVILTYHDLGLNYICFLPFFNYVDMRALLEEFCVYHVNAPGQEVGAFTFPDEYVYPTMDELANQLNYVLDHFNIKSFIGFGVGAGANVLARFARSNPKQVDALTLVDCTASTVGWIEWVGQKKNIRTLRTDGMSQGVIDYLLWHYFGRLSRNENLTQQSYFTQKVNPRNLSLFITSYIQRTDLGIARWSSSLDVPVLNVTGSYSVHVEETVALNGRLSPTKTDWMKISDCALALEEQPGKMAQAFRLFLQGEGYAVLRLQKIFAGGSVTSMEF